jgi:intein/homing endonuclease
VEFAIGDQFLQKSRTTGKPESDDKIRAYEEYMLEAQAALREPPNELKSRIDDLESKIRRLGDVEQNLIPSLRGTNDVRIRLATAHEELLRALTSK